MLELNDCVSRRRAMLLGASRLMATWGAINALGTDRADGFSEAAASRESLTAKSTTFRLSFSPTVRETPFTGRVYLFFSGNEKSPRRGPNWFHPEPFLSRDVVDLRPGDEVELSLDAPETLRFPSDLTPDKLRSRYAQGVVRFNRWERRVGDGPGNGYSATLAADEFGGWPRFSIDQIETQPPFPELKWCRLLEVASPLLSQFHGRPVFMRASVLLPASYFDAPTRRYPTIFTIPGFGGTHLMGLRNEPVREENPQGVEFLRVVLDPSCPWGHHVFADSATNGPWGRALVDDFLSAYEAEYRSIAEPRGRLLTGHSSGGWSSFWLQITHPEVFGGVWSTAPDPVDFRDFQRINIYRPGENMYVDPQQQRRPLARFGDKIALWYDDFAQMEHVMGPGGQLQSFEAVFSPLSTAGEPRQLWNRTTGEIDPVTAAAWKDYDINLVIQSRWKQLQTTLSGKLNLFMGEADTFYLDGASRLLQQTLHDLGSDAVVELSPGKDHSSLMTKELRDRIRSEMATRTLRG
ncbi:MAG: alpha/beta hydrolase-fold protein [Planctomycetaceae bacterium]